MPKISVIIPCYNQADYLEETLNSVLGQTHENWECILINDGSTDHTAEICKEYFSKDPRFKFIDKKNEGVNKARNRGIEAATANWLMFLDSDDILLPHRLEAALTHIGTYNFIVTDFECYGDGQRTPAFVDLSSRAINFENLLAGWDMGFNLPIHCVTFSRELLGNTRFHTDLKAKEDFIFWLEILRKLEASPVFIPEVSALYRQHAGGASKIFESTFRDEFTANAYLYNLYSDEASRHLLFDKLNRKILNLQEVNFNQKNYIRQLQNTKILKYYLKLKSLMQK